MTRYFVDYDCSDRSYVVEETDDIVKRITDNVAVLYREGVYRVDDPNEPPSSDPNHDPDFHRVHYAQNDQGVEWSDRDQLDWHYLEVEILPEWCPELR